jgi:pectinesterase
MHTITVSPTDPNANFPTLGAAIASLQIGQPTTILLKMGTYHEKIYCDHDDLTIIGEGPGQTVLTWADGGFHPFSDGHKTGTFRSYTAWFTGGRIRLENLSVVNAAGDGRIHGQAIALAIDAVEAHVTNVHLLGHQDTLYVGPLPEFEREPGGFRGPSLGRPRLTSNQIYKECYITGDIDFIFGGANALFEDCVLDCRNRDEVVNGYIAAPSTDLADIGFVFWKCRVLTNSHAANSSFYLARPWRDFGAATFIDCVISDVIHPDLFDDWDNIANRKTSRFAISNPPHQPAFGRVLSGDEAREFVSSMKRN